MLPARLLERHEVMQLSIGFVDTGCSDNHGTSTVDIDADCMTAVAQTSWSTIKALYR